MAGERGSNDAEVVEEDNARAKLGTRAILRRNKNISVGRVWNRVGAFLSDERRLAISDGDNCMFASQILLMDNSSSPKQLSTKEVLVVMVRWFIIEATKTRGDGRNDGSDGTNPVARLERQHGRSRRLE